MTIIEPKFKLGDRVSIAHSGYNDYPLGVEGKIVMHWNLYQYLVLFVFVNPSVLVLNESELNLVESEQLDNIVELGYN